MLNDVKRLSKNNVKIELFFRIQNQIRRTWDVSDGHFAGAKCLFAVEGPGRALCHFEGDVAGAEEFYQLAVVKVGLHNSHCDLR